MELLAIQNGFERRICFRVGVIILSSSNSINNTINSTFFYSSNFYSNQQLLVKENIQAIQL